MLPNADLNLFLRNRRSQKGNPPTARAEFTSVAMVTGPNPSSYKTGSIAGSGIQTPLNMQLDADPPVGMSTLPFGFLVSMPDFESSSRKLTHEFRSRNTRGQFTPRPATASSFGTSRWSDTWEKFTALNVLYQWRYSAGNSPSHVSSSSTIRRSEASAI